MKRSARVVALFRGGALGVTLQRKSNWLPRTTIERSEAERAQAERSEAKRSEAERSGARRIIFAKIEHLTDINSITTLQQLYFIIKLTL